MKSIGSRKTLHGISLLETLAALVILSAGAAVMLTWFSQNAVTLSRLKDSESLEQGRLEALEYLRTINPVEKPRGEVVLNQYRIAWTSRQSAETVRAVTALGSPGRYEVSMYELDVRLSKADAAPSSSTLARMSLPLTGYKLVAATGTSMFGDKP
jgi:general secretion pathway protein I